MFEFLVRLLISPLNLSLTLAIIGALCIRFKLAPMLIGTSLIGVSIVWLLLCSQYMFSYLLISPLEQNFQVVKIEDEKWQESKAIWVLACYHYDAEELPEVSQFNRCSLERLVHAANMHRKKNIPIYLTGGIFNNRSKINHAQKAADFLYHLGVPKSDLIIINAGTNTREESVAILANNNHGKLAIVSSATHGNRISNLMIAGNQAFIFIPVHFATSKQKEFELNFPSIDSIAKVERALYEYAALARDQLLL